MKQSSFFFQTPVGISTALRILSGVLIPVTLVSCGCSGAKCQKGKRRQLQQYSQEQARVAQQVHEIRAKYHRQEKAKELPKLPEAAGSTMLPKRRYYQVPVPGYTAPDGVIIDAHTRTLEIIQP